MDYDTKDDTKDYDTKAFEVILKRYREVVQETVRAMKHCKVDRYYGDTIYPNTRDYRHLLKVDDEQRQMFENSWPFNMILPEMLKIAQYQDWLKRIKYEGATGNVIMYEKLQKGF